MSWPLARLEELVPDDAPIMYGILQPGPNLPGGVPYVRPTEIGEAGINISEIRRTSTAIARQYRRSTLEPGDLLLSIVGTIGKVAKVPPELAGGNITQSTVRIRPRGSRVDGRFLFWALRSPAVRRQYDEARLGTGVPRLNVAHVRDLRVPVPPLPEQRRIADILDKADAVRRKRKEAIALTEELLRSAFLEMFGDSVTNPKEWPTAELRTVIVDGPQNGLYQPATDYGSGTPILRIDSFYDGEVVDVAELKRVRIEPGLVTKYRLSENDIVINRVNSRKFLGKSALVPKLAESTVFESNMMRLTLDVARAHPGFLIEELQQPSIRRQIDSAAKDAVNQSSINQGDVNAFIVRLPPLVLQGTFARVADAVRRALRKQSEAYAATSALFASLVQRAFRGELDARTAKAGREPHGVAISPDAGLALAGVPDGPHYP